MTRFRLTFVALGVVLSSLLGTLVWRALESIDSERDLRRQIVAERVFDEMERELTALVRREEDRPFEHYRSYYVLESGAAGAVARLRSPLADAPREPFIVGYFLVSPEGTVTTPQESVDPSSFARLTSAVTKRESMDVTPAPARSQALGTTRALSQSQVVAPIDSNQEEARSEDYLRELNRGAASRQDRVSKLSQSAATNVGPYAEADRERSAEQVVTELEQASGEGSSPVDIVLDSFVGERIDDDYLVLTRRATVTGRDYRQGLVLETRELVDWLAQRVVAGSELATRFEILPDSLASPFPRRAELTYRHQFGEPFGGLAALLVLPPLTDSGATGFVYLLSILTLGAGAAGLVGIYRMVEARVAFAERRQNFVSAVSHELKTPLTAIRLYGEMLRDGLVADEDKRAHYYGVITSESERLTRLVNNVLELSNLERRQRSVNLVVGPIRPVLEEARNILAPHAAQEGFAIRLEVEPDLPEAIYDRDALLQVLFNLIDNAVKYSKNAARRDILLSAHRQASALEIAIRDQGPGVGEAHLKRVFEPFYRGEAEMTRRSRGTGIGLALVKGLVESMGGAVGADNGDDGGFVVRLTLRLASATAQPSG
jgi:signal transduction histidine kinase